LKKWHSTKLKDPLVKDKRWGEQKGIADGRGGMGTGALQTRKGGATNKQSVLVFALKETRNASKSPKD